MTYKRYTVSCLLCKSEVSTSNLKTHYNSKQCLAGGKVSDKFQVKRDKQPKTIKSKECRYCFRICHSFGGLGKHEASCQQNSNRKQQYNKYSKAKSRGEIATTSDDTRHKLSIAGTGRKHSEQEIKNISIGMKRAVKNKPDSFRGTYNRGNVKKFVCSNGFTVLGSWEKLFVEFCLENNLKIEQPIIPFSYEFEGTRVYFPDFFLSELKMYIEVKGMQTDRDLAKWDAITNIHKLDLIVIEKTAIRSITRNEFTPSSLSNFRYIN